MIGEVLGHYRVVAKIGEGGMGVVYRKQIFDEEETAEINKIPAKQLPGLKALMPFLSLSGEARAKVRMSITNLYRSSSKLHGNHLYYFEAEKQYEKPADFIDQACYDVSLFQGWIEASDQGGLGLKASRVFLTNCDRKGPSFATPLGIMT